MKLLKYFEKTVIWVLIALLGLVVVAALLQLGYEILSDMLCTSTPLIDVSELMSILGSLLMVLIGLELLQTVREYLADSKLHVEMVILVGMVALARKAIIFDYKDTSWHYLVGMGLLFIAFAVGYFIVRKSNLDFDKA